MTSKVNQMLNEETSLDQIDSFFRIRLVCVLLDTCGQYFDRGSTKKKLDCFLVYFQRYYLFKKETAAAASQEQTTSGVVNNKVVDPIIDIEFLFTETLASLRPGFKRAATYQDACEQVTKMENEVRESLNKVLPAGLLKATDSNTAESGATNLATIQEGSDGEHDDFIDEEGEERQQQENEEEEGAAGNEDEDQEDYDDDEDDDDDDDDEEEEEEGGNSKRLTRKSGDSASEDVDDFNVSASRMGKQVKADDKEDDEFIKEFESLVVENIAVNILFVRKA
jgi:regulator of nonsense transcripts 2